MKFFPADWRSEPTLRLCSAAARGLWIEMLCLMHEAEPIGSLVIKGCPVTDAELASLTGLSRKETLALLRELDERGVLSRDPNGVIFSRRMRRDAEKAERDKANGRAGGNPALKGGVNPLVNGKDKGGDKAQKLEARGQRSPSDEKGSSQDVAQGQEGWSADAPFGEPGR